MENAKPILRKVYSAIIGGQIVEDNRGKVYIQEFGQAFLDEIRTELENTLPYDIIDIYRDGGTKKVLIKGKTRFIDFRIGTTTKGAVYKGYPSDPDSTLLFNNIEDFLRSL